MKVTVHAAVERIDRIVYIAKNIGWGEGIAVEVRREDRGTREFLTDSGVLIIKDMNEDIFVTAYIPTYERTISLYKMAGKRMPSYIAAKVKKNQKYAKDCY
jgi:hypothetical protein